MLSYVKKCFELARNYEVVIETAQTIIELWNYGNHVSLIQYSVVLILGMQCRACSICFTATLFIRVNLMIHLCILAHSSSGQASFLLPSPGVF